jgi:hypothetical protein
MAWEKTTVYLTPEAVTAAGVPNPIDGELGVFTITADTADSHPAFGADPPSDVGHSTVTAENVQTADRRQVDPFPVELNFGIFGDEEEWGLGPA